MILLKKHGILIFLLVYYILGIYLCSDYGSFWDELIQRDIAIVSSKHAINILAPKYIEILDPDNKVPDIENFIGKEYGVAFEFPVLMLEYIFKIKDKGDIIYLRHLSVFTFFVISLWFMYRLFELRFRKRVYGYLAIFLVILNPRLFAESFYNSKDIVFLSAIIILLYYFLQYIRNKSLKNSLMLSFLMAFAFCIRPLAIIFPFFLVCFWLSDVLFLKLRLLDEAKKISLIMIFWIVAVYVMYPFLWRSPIENFAAIFQSMSKYPWNGNSLFMGHLINQNNLPWYYSFVWIGITVPVVFTILFLYGLTCFILRMKFKNLLSGDRLDFVILGILLIPLVSVVILHSNMYDSWRHLYFIYTGMVFLMIYGIDYLISRISVKTQYLAGFLIGFGFIFPAWKIVTIHPYQNVYFNSLVKPEHPFRFERDYWGLSYRKGLEYIAGSDSSGNLRVFPEYFIPARNNYYLLSKQDQRKIQLVSNIDSADYHIGCFRSSGADNYDDNEVYALYSGKIKILTVSQIRNKIIK